MGGNMGHSLPRYCVSTWTVRCPRCGERAVDVALDNGGEATDYDGIRCGFCGELDEPARDAAVEDAAWHAEESARSRDVN